MSLIVEDGTAKPDAESYISAADATTYHANRGNTAWPTDPTAQEQLLRKASDYMQEVYRVKWAGVRSTATQALDWPRINVPMPDGPGYAAGWPTFYPINTVPTEVSRACAELALKAVSGDLAPEEGQAIKQETVGPITTIYQDYSVATRTYRAIDRLLQPFLTASGGARAVRA
jgi:hypothetical protein